MSSGKKARMESAKSTSSNKSADKNDKQSEQIQQLLAERIKTPFANTIEEFFENPMSLALRPHDLIKNIDVSLILLLIYSSRFKCRIN